MRFLVALLCLSAPALSQNAARPAAAVPRTHNFEPTQFEHAFSGKIAPVLHINAGDTVKTWSVDAGGTDPKGAGMLEPLAQFKANPAGAAIVNAVGPIRQVVKSDVPAQRRYLVIAPVDGDKPGAPVQVQATNGE